MNYNMKIALTAVALFLMTCSGKVHADTAVGFSVDGGTTLGDSFVVDSGSTATVSVFLTETSPDTTLADDGLLGFGLRGNLTSGSGEITSGNINSVFDFRDTEEFTSSGIAWQGLAFNNQPPQGSRILLGQFDYSVTTEGSSTFEFVDFQTGSGSENVNWLTGAGAELDEVIFGNESAGSFQLTLSTSAVPEPSSIVVLTLASSFFAVRRRRRRE